MTTADMIQTVKDNLGNRNSGRIGSRDVDVVVREALNLAVPHTVQEAQPDYYNRTCSLTLTAAPQQGTVEDRDDWTTMQLTRPGGIPSGTLWYTTDTNKSYLWGGSSWVIVTEYTSLQDFRVYDLPTRDDEGGAIRIKDIYGYRCRRGDGTSVDMKQLNYADFVNRTPNYDLNYTGTPGYFALWGQHNKMHLDYLPSEEFTMTLYVEVYPPLITSAQDNQALPIDDQWNIVVEAFATKHCYLKLQQTQMYGIWEELYLKQKASISREENEKQSKNINAGSKPLQITDPALNPAARSWN